ncbi:MAG: DNA recombination protein RmuC [Planctomycetes bacterium]|nr:DNA recombination protein RmuC [Planctomycetota bacterium]
MDYALCVLAGLVIGSLAAWLIASVRITRSLTTKIEDSERRANLAEGRSSTFDATLAELRGQAAKSTEDVSELREKLRAETSAKVTAETRLAESMQRFEEEKKLLADAKAQLTDTFKALAGDTLSSSTKEFLQLAKETFDKTLIDAKGDLGKRQEAIQGLVKPLAEAIQGLVKPLADSLSKYDERVRAIEKDRLEAYTGLTEQLKHLGAGHQQLQKETANLVTALRRPEVRGKWGEVTLDTLLELSGMSEHCIRRQVTAKFEDKDGVSRDARPDLVISLPADREIVIDSKVAIEALLDEVVEADSDEKRRSAMGRHVKHLRAHIDNLGKKEYWDLFEKTPDFVVMFISVEASFHAAVSTEPGLVEYGFRKRVLLATPTTLFALLKALAYGWRQEQIVKNIEEIRDAGKDILDKIAIFAGHFAEIRKGLIGANNAYDKAVGSMERNLLKAAKNLEELGLKGKKEIQAIDAIGTTPRQLTAPELVEETLRDEGVRV